MAGRFLAGLGHGIATLLAQLYVSEVVVPKYRGRLSSFPQLFVVNGVLAAYVTGAAVDYIRLAYVGAAIVPINFAVLILVPESPAIEVVHGKYEQAERSLRWLRGGGDVSVHEELEELIEYTRRETETSFSLAELKRREFLAPFFICLFLMWMQQFSAINVVIFYTKDVFVSAEVDIDPDLSVIITGAIGVVCTTISASLADKAGRRVLLLVSGVGMAISLAGLGTYYYLNENGQATSSLSWLPLVSLSLYISMFSAGWGPIPWVVMGELFSPRVRSFTGAVQTAFNWLCGFGTTSSFNALTGAIGDSWVFWMYAIFNVVGVIFVFFFLPETKGQSFAEINAKFRKGHPPPITVVTTEVQEAEA